MKIYLVPVGRTRYELYSEQAGELASAAPEIPQSGVIARARHGFAEMLLAAADRERAKREGRWTEPSNRMARFRDMLTAWVAERVAEQQLHWNLRHIEAAVLVHPADVTGDAAMATVRQALAHDRRWHMRWAAVHAVLFVVSAVFAVIPGPNLIAYYFAFRMVGNWFSMRGAWQGLNRVSWTTCPSVPLAELREVLPLVSATRRQLVADIAERLQLRDLGAFVERVSLRRA